MIYALASVPKNFTGQEISAQDLNNLAQNSEILEHIVHGPDRLFLSSWRLAPPVFSLITQKAEAGNPNNFAGYQQAILISDIDVWEGSFVYREGMHTLRLAFNTFAIIEKGAGKYAWPLDLSSLRETYYPRATTKLNSDYVNESVSLFLSVKYTDLPLNQQLEKYPKFARSWVYASNKASTYKQPHNKDENSYTFIADATHAKESWNANNLRLDGYHTYTLDITQFDFVPGEIVNLKFRIATRDKKPVRNEGRHFYFSMVYANIDHALLDTTAWKTITNESITSVDKMDEISSNQQVLVDYFKKYDNPLRASIWDQVMAGGSTIPFYARYEQISFQGLANWGFNEKDDYRYRNTHASQARYYLPKRFDLKNTVSLSYNVQVNSKTAFSIQAQLSKKAVVPGYIYKSRDTEDSFTDPAFIYSKRDLPIVGGHPVLAFPNEIPLGRMNYKDQHITAEQQLTDTVFARVGKVNFMGTYPHKQNGVLKTIETQLMPEGITIPAGYPDTREFLYCVGENSLLDNNQNNWYGFHFIRPGRLGDGGVPYYAAFGTKIKGLEQNMFLGPTATSGEYRDASVYVDDFNFVLDSQNPRPGVSANTYFYPNMYREYGGLATHDTYRITAGSDYTDFTINTKESSSNWSSNVSFFMTPSGRYSETFSRPAFNKASYISTLRIAEVARKESSSVLEAIDRFESFQEVSIEDLIQFLKLVNTKQNEVYNLITQDPVFKYIPVFWNKPKSTLRHFEKTTIGEEQSEDTYFKNMEMNTLYFSSARQADYLIVRGRNVSIGWNGFTKIYRDNPKNIIFPAPLEFEFTQSQSVCGNDIETTIIGFDTLEGLAYGMRYYLQGDIYYAAETMGIP